MHKDDTIIAKEEPTESRAQAEDDIDLLDDLMYTGLNSIKNNDKPPSKQINKRLPKISKMPNPPGGADEFFESIEKKMEQGERSKENKETPPPPQFKVPAKKDSPEITESAKYCSELMNSDSIKPYNSEGTPAGGSG